MRVLSLEVMILLLIGMIIFTGFVAYLHSYLQCKYVREKDHEKDISKKCDIINKFSALLMILKILVILSIISIGLISFECGYQISNKIF